MTMSADDDGPIEFRMRFYGNLVQETPLRPLYLWVEGDDGWWYPEPNTEQYDEPDEVEQ